MHSLHHARYGTGQSESEKVNLYIGNTLTLLRSIVPIS